MNFPSGRCCPANEARCLAKLRHHPLTSAADGFDEGQTVHQNVPFEPRRRKGEAISRLCTAARQVEESIRKIEHKVEPYAVPFDDKLRRLDGIPGVNRVGACCLLVGLGVDMGSSRRSST